VERRAKQKALVLDDPTDLLGKWHDAECDFFDSSPLFLKAGWFHSGKFPSEAPFLGPRSPDGAPFDHIYDGHPSRPRQSV